MKYTLFVLVFFSIACQEQARPVVQKAPSFRVATCERHPEQPQEDPKILKQKRDRRIARIAEMMEISRDEAAAELADIEIAQEEAEEVKQAIYDEQSLRYCVEKEGLICNECDQMFCYDHYGNRHILWQYEVGTCKNWLQEKRERLRY